MCGIAGILRFDGVAPDPALLHRMTDAIAHRGPDGTGHWQEGPLALGHRRLAIIDLSENANQPMWSSDGSLAIVFNGEIYGVQNFDVKTRLSYAWAVRDGDIDPDEDGVVTTQDNCTLVANPDQCDSDADGYGNRCDGDMNNNSFTNTQDYVLFRAQLGQPSGPSGLVP